MRTPTSKIYSAMTANYWVYVNAGADFTRGVPLMVHVRIAPGAPTRSVQYDTVSDRYGTY